MEQNFSIFGITSPINQLVDADKDFDLMQTIEDYEVELYLSKNVYHHDLEDDPKDNFNYRYAIEAYYSEENDETYYYLMLIPTFGSLSAKRQADVRDMVGMDETDTPNEIDVHDYGIQIIMGRENVKGQYDKSVVDKIASVVDVIDRMRGFYLDKAQNRLGSTGWDMLDDYINGNDFLKATLDRYDSSK
jgi:hypothetical protein